MTRYRVHLRGRNDRATRDALTRCGALVAEGPGDNNSLGDLVVEVNEDNAQAAVERVRRAVDRLAVEVYDSAHPVA